MSMSRLRPDLLLVIMNYVLLNDSKMTTKTVYKPYGPKMCVELCEDSAEQFHYTEEDLSCRRIQADVFRPSEYRIGCLSDKANNNTHLTALQGIDRSNVRYKGKGSPNLRTRLTTEGKHTGNPDCKTLHQACKRGELPLTKNILSNKLADINCRGRKGETPVMAAAKNGQVDVVNYLVSQGCDLSAEDDFNNNVLHAACASGNSHIVRNLIDSEKTDMDSRGWNGRTPIMNAAGYGNKDVFDLLVRRGCDLTVVDNRNNNILHAACAGGSLDVVKYILSQSVCHVDSTGFRGRTPIMVAAEKGHIKVFALLLQHGCNVTALDDYRKNVLHVACGGGHVDMVKYILSRKLIDIESRELVGRTALLIAAGCGQRDVLDMLVSKGCKLEAVDAQNNTILHVACIGGHVEMVDYILSKNIFGIESKGYEGRTPVMSAVEKGHRGVFDFLRCQGCNLTAVDEVRNNILHHACSRGDVGLVKHILTLGIVDVEDRNNYRETPALVAELKGHIAVAALLNANI